MAGPNRAALITKMYKVLKQHYKPVVTRDERPLLQQMLFACCLENAHYDKAEKVYAHLASSFFDWNEVRVSTVKELAEAMRELPNAETAAANLKSILQNVFEATYSFELESVKKQNLGVGIKRLAKFEGASPFVIGYVTQQALGGHSIPVGRGTLDVLYIVGIASEAERKAGTVAGLERAIPKNKGIEFGSLLHQFTADYVANAFSPNVKNLLLSMNPDSKLRMPKRGQKIPMEMEEKPAPEKSSARADAALVAGKPAKGGGRGKEVAAHKPEKHSVKRDDPKDGKKSKPIKSVAAGPMKKQAPGGKPSKTVGAGNRSSHQESSARARGGARPSESSRLIKRKPK